MSDTITLFSADELAAMAERERAASKGDWIAIRMVNAETDGRPLTVEEIGEYVMNSVRKSALASGTEDFLSILVEKPDGPADVCHVGNGPTSPANALFIAAARNEYARLVAVAQWANELVPWLQQHRQELIARGSIISLKELDALLARLTPPENAGCLFPIGSLGVDGPYDRAMRRVDAHQRANSPDQARACPGFDPVAIYFCRHCRRHKDEHAGETR